MKETKKGSSGIPVVIIVLVLVVVVVGGFIFYRQSQPTTRSNTVATTNTTSTNQRPPLNMAAAPPGAQPPNTLGSPAATVTIEEFADFQCGSCAAAHPVMKDITSAYAGNKNVRFVFRNFPLAMHDKAYDAAVAAEAAGVQGSSKFWQMQDQLFSNQHNWTNADSNYRDLFVGYAQKIGLDVEKFKADMSGMQAKTRVDQDMTRGRALNVGSTPTIIVNGRVVPFAEVTSAGMRRIIDSELQAAAQPSQAVPSANNSISN
jgi:protein-disulfide isomerase